MSSPPAKAPEPPRRGEQPVKAHFDVDTFFGVQRNTRLPDPSPLIGNLAQCVIEVLAGAREVEQLARWVTDDVYAYVLRRTMLSARARAAKGVSGRRPVFAITSVHAQEPVPGIVEATVIVRMPERVRAVAIRLEGMDSRWRASAIAIL